MHLSDSVVSEPFASSVVFTLVPVALVLLFAMIMCAGGSDDGKASNSSSSSALPNVQFTFAQGEEPKRPVKKQKKKPTTAKPSSARPKVIKKEGKTVSQTVASSKTCKTGASIGSAKGSGELVVHSNDSMCSYKLLKPRSTQEFLPDTMVSAIPTPENPDIPI